MPTKTKKNIAKKKGININNVIYKTWPKAKKEMEKGIHEAKKIVVQGEKHLGQLTDKSLNRLRLVVLNHRREVHCHKLGKLAIKVPRTRLGTDKVITKQLSEVKKIDKEIREIEKQLNSKK